MPNRRSAVTCTPSRIFAATLRSGSIYLGPDDIRRYQVYLREERKLDIGTAANYVAALRFFCVKTLKRPDLREDLPYPNGVNRKRRLPTILSQAEVSRLIDSSKNLFHYAMLLTIYWAGLRRSELCRLKVSLTSIASE
jgi:integrase/recombinase XerD